MGGVVYGMRMRMLRVSCFYLCNSFIAGQPPPATAAPLVDIFDTAPEPVIPVSGSLTLSPGVEQAIRK